MSAGPETSSATIRSGDRVRTYPELYDRASRAAAGLATLGVGAGDAVALLLRNDFPFFEAALAAGMLGAYAVPINWHFQSDEVGYLLGDSGAKALVGHADLLGAVKDAIPAGLTCLAVPTPPEIQAAYGASERDGRVPAGLTAWDDWLAGFTPHVRSSTPPPGAMLYTGGTTGRPKAVRYRPPTLQQAQGMVSVRAQIFDIRPDMRAALVAPLYHSAPYSYCLGVVRAGGNLAMLPRFDAEGLLALIEQERISHLYAVPTMFVRLLRLPEATRRRYDVSSLRWVIHAAAPCPPEVKRAMLDWWGPVIYEAYAATETGWLTLCTPEDARTHPGSVGRLIDGSEVRILDEEGRALPTGEVGEISARHEVMPEFTYHGKDDQRRAIDRDGLVTAGDIGYLDEDGYLYLCDRRIDMIISGGANIYPAEIEAALIAMPGVLDCAVFGVPDEEYGEAVAAAVQPEQGADLSPDDVIRYLRERIAHYKVPRMVEFHVALPRLESGKLLKRQLRDPHWKGMNRTI